MVIMPEVSTPVYQRIVLPTDLSACAERALPRALALAERAGAEVHLLYVVPPVEAEGTVAPTLDAEEFGLWREERARARLQGLRLTYRYGLNSRNAVSIQTSIVTHADTSAGILSYVRRQKADLIVMGTHGWSAHFGKGLGSVTQRVLTAAPCPVMTVPVHRPTVGLIRRVLLSVKDLKSADALHYADQLAHLFQSRLVLLTGAEQPDALISTPEKQEQPGISLLPPRVRAWVDAQPFQTSAVEYRAPHPAASRIPLVGDLEDTDVVVVPETQAALRLVRTGTCSVVSLGGAKSMRVRDQAFVANAA